jgi:AGZA family xanthine/uracil permease-like MFS transporter
MTCLPFILLFIFMDMFDTVGTLVGVAEQAGFMKDNKLPRASRVLVVDAAGTVAGACMGTSTITSYIESSAGVAYGGRTGLTSVTTGLLFLAALLFSPLIGTISGYPPITACALVIVGAIMMKNAERIDWEDYSESIPAFLVAIGIPLTFSIADGLAMGFISYPIIKIISGKARKTNWLMYLVAVILLMYILFIRFHTN